MKSDIEIARSIELTKIKQVARDYDIPVEEIHNYGRYIAKVPETLIDEEKVKQSNLILVTAITPTKAGIGKTTVSIGLALGLTKIGKKAICALREPSLGPCFGMKGGAAGGGYAQVLPMDKINLHFTGDFHAITSAHNMIAALLDNYMYQNQDNGFALKEVLWNRVLDVNDRGLRYIITGLGGKTNGITRESGFDITPASEIMAILCLAKDEDDLRRRIENILLGFTIDNKPFTVKDLGVAGAITVLLKDAIAPNLVQTTEHTAAFVHGGPFANIAHGCSSLTSIKMALKHAPYVVTEAGFGADLGAEKFLDITVQEGNLDVSLIVLNVTIRSLKHHGGVKKENLPNLDLDSLKQGLSNLECHISNLKQYTSNLLVVLNKFNTDYEEEINLVKSFVQSKNLEFVVNNSYLEGSNGSIDFAKKVVTLCHKEKIKRLYDVNASIPTKIEHLAKNIYHAKHVKYTKKALDEIKLLESLNLDKMPICVAKTPMSISDNKELLGYPKDYQINVTDIKISNGAGFIIVYMGNILTMPGLSKNAAYLNMKIDKNKKIEGLF